MFVYADMRCGRDLRRIPDMFRIHDVSRLDIMRRGVHLRWHGDVQLVGNLWWYAYLRRCADML